MRASSKIAVFISVAILYCCIVSFYDDGIAASVSTSSKNQPAQEESRFSSVSLNLYGKAIQTRNVVNVLTNFQVNTPKNHFKDDSAGSEAAELLRVSHFSRYIFYTANHIISFQPTDIIFPFHYFW